VSPRYRSRAAMAMLRCVRFSSVTARAERRASIGQTRGRPGALPVLRTSRL
jgi:hypothetical protein